MADFFSHFSVTVSYNFYEWVLFLFLFFHFLSVRVSNELGSGHPRAAKYSVVVIVLESLLIGIVSASIIMITKDHFAIIFTDSKEMQKAVSKLASLLGITMILNSVQPVLSGKRIPPNIYIYIPHAIVRKSWNATVYCFRCCCRRRMAGFSSLHQSILLLLDGTPSWLFSWLQGGLQSPGKELHYYSSVKTSQFHHQSINYYIKKSGRSLPNCNACHLQVVTRALFIFN